MRFSWSVLFFLFLQINFIGICREIKFVPLNQEIKNLEIKLKKNPSDFELLKLLVKKQNLSFQYLKAEKNLKQFKKKYENRFPNLRSEIYLNLAITYKFQKESDKATFFFLKANDAFLKLKDFKGLVNYGIELIEFNRSLGKHEEGEKNYYRYLHIYKKHKLQSYKLLNGLFNRYAAVLNETNRGHISINYSLKAIEMAEKVNDYEAMAISYNELGFSYKNLLKIDQSVDSYKKAEDIFYDLGYLREFLNVRMNRLEVLDHNGKLTSDESIRFGIGMIHIIDSFGVDFSKIRPYTLLRQGYIVIKDFENALYIQYEIKGEQDRELIKSREEAIFNIQEKYQNDKLAQKNLQFVERAKAEQEKLQAAQFQMLLIFIALLIVVLVLIALYYLWNKLRKTNKLLTKINKQKTILVQEIHHRVKNNLQFVRSMLEMQIAVEDSESSSTSLADVSRRIDAMSLVHEMLFIDEESMGISVKSYLERLIDLSLVLYNKDVKLKCEFDIADTELSIDKVVSLGIICSELMTNSVKHAFHENQKPAFKILFFKENNQFHLTVSDNGVEKLVQSESKTKSLGMRLIDIFSRQLNGEYVISRENGYIYSLKF